MPIHRFAALVLILVVPVAFAQSIEHPRLLFGTSDISTIKERAKHPKLKPFVDRLMQRADAVFNLPALHVSLTARGEKDAPGELKGLSAARYLQGRVVTLCMAYTLSGEKKYRDEAVAQLDHALTDWKIWVDTAHPPPYDLMTGEVCATFGLAYDWLYPDLTPDERKRLREGAVKRGLDPYLAAVAKKMGFIHNDNNWNCVCNGGATLLALALEGETPAAEKALASTVPGMKHYWDHLAPDGGWEEGTGYWTYGHRYGFLAAEALRRNGNKFGNEVFAREGVKRTCYFPMVFNPGTKLTASFGDSPGRANDPIFYLLGREFKNADFIWAQDRVRLSDPKSEGWPVEALALLWRPVGENWLPEARSDFMPKFDAVYGFPSIGWGFMAPKQPDPPIWLSFKNGSLGANHTHLDLNAVAVGINDVEILAELGSRPYPGNYFGPKRYGYYEISTAGNNSILVGGKGQTHGKPGKLLGPFKGADFEEFVGIADRAYDVDTPAARRNAVFVDKRYWVLLDDLRASAPQNFELRFHTYGTIKDANPMSWTFEQNDVALDISSASTLASPLTGTEEKPEGWIKPVNVLSIKTSTPSARFICATVLYPRAKNASPCGAMKVSRTGADIHVKVGADEIVFKESNEMDGWRAASVKLGK